MINFSTLPELSLYVHLPWCIRKCPYCDFNSHEKPDGIPESKYVDALMRDLEQFLPWVWGRPLVSIFIGGGTPSLFSSASIARLISEIRARVKCLPDLEITLEANPGSFEADRFRGFADAGVNRLSIGIQSFDNQQLKTLGRVHDREQAIAAAALAVEIFPRVNIDLMFGLPSQSMAMLKADLEQAINLGVGHISCYQLTMEPNTRFALQPPPGLPDEEFLADMQALVVDRLKQSEFDRYEISAFCKPGQASQHNLNYWTFGDYLGIGAGAHGKISSAQRIVRTTRVRHPASYMESIGRTPINETEVSIEALPFEFMLNALRLVEGVPSHRWAQTTGIDVGAHPRLLDQIVAAQKAGLLSFTSGRFQATARGYELLNDLQSVFL